MDNNMDNSKMGKLVHIAFVMGSAYALTLVFSHLNHAFRHPNIIELYIKFGPIAILGHYSIPILFFIFILLSFFALLLKNRKILSSPHSNLFISCLLALILVIYTHSLYCLHLYTILYLAPNNKIKKSIFPSRGEVQNGLAGISTNNKNTYLRHLSRSVEDQIFPNKSKLLWKIWTEDYILSKGGLTIMS